MILAVVIVEGTAYIRSSMSVRTLTESVYVGMNRSCFKRILQLILVDQCNTHANVQIDVDPTIRQEEHLLTRPWRHLLAGSL